MKTHKVSVGAALDDWKQDRGYEQDINPELIKKWANDAAARMMTDEQLVHHITILIVRDYRAELPQDFKFVNQVAYNVDYNKKITREQLVEWVGQADNGCKVNVSLDCPDCEPSDTECDRPVVTVDVNRIWASANPQTQTAYMKYFYGYGGTSIRDGQQGCWAPPNFTLMRPAQGTFFNMPMHLDGCTIGVDNAIEYKIEPPNIITNFKEGQILLSYMGADMDNEGWYYIPNIPDVFDAISYSIEEKLARRAYAKTPSSGSRALWSDMLAQKERMTARAKSKLQIPDAEDWMVLMRNHFNKLVPYWQYESNYNRAQSDQYLSPNETYNWNQR